MKKNIIFAICAMATTSCQSPTLYSWYGSEDATYTYTKRGTDVTLEKAMQQYEKVLKKQKGLRKVVPPGVKQSTAISFVKQERK